VVFAKTRGELVVNISAGFYSFRACRRGRLLEAPAGACDVDHRKAMELPNIVRGWAFRRLCTGRRLERRSLFGAAYRHRFDHSRARQRGRKSKPQSRAAGGPLPCQLQTLNVIYGARTQNCLISKTAQKPPIQPSRPQIRIQSPAPNPETQAPHRAAQNRSIAWFTNEQ
jgi:hypothetical protein